MPKPNMYQSLHTTLIAPNGQPFEIQIRTYEMHRTAEYGIAAHWKYKENIDGTKGDDSEEAKLTWLRQILEWQRDMSDNKEFLNLIKSDLDLFSDSVYCLHLREMSRTFRQVPHRLILLTASIRQSAIRWSELKLTESWLPLTIRLRMVTE